MTAQYPGKPEPYVRAACRERFHEAKLLARILPDIDDLLQIGPEPEAAEAFETDPALPADLWNALLDHVAEA